MNDVETSGDSKMDKHVVDDLVTAITTDARFHGQCVDLVRRAEDYSGRGLCNAWLGVVNGYIERNLNVYGDRDGARPVPARERFHIALKLMDSFEQLVGEIDTEIAATPKER